MFVTIKTKGNFAHQEAEIRGLNLQRESMLFSWMQMTDWHPKSSKSSLGCSAEENIVLCCIGRELVDVAGDSLRKYILVHEKISYRMLLRQRDQLLISLAVKRCCTGISDGT